MAKEKINFNLLNVLFGQLVSKIGDIIYMLALSFWVLDTTKSSAATGIVLFSSMAPAIVLGFILGGFVDRRNKKHLMIIADVIRGCVIGMVTILFYLKALNLPVIIVAQVLLSICATFFNPAVFAIIPMIVTRDYLAKANAQSQLIDGFTLIIGPVLGGAGIAFLGYGFVFAANAISFLISAVFECFIKIPSNNAQNTEENQTVSIKIVDGYKYIFRRNKLKVILVMVVMGHFIVGTLQIIMPVLSKIIQGNGAQNLGYIQTAFGIGAIVASLLIILININNKEEKLMFAGITLIGLIYIALGVINRMDVKILAPYLGIILLFGVTIIFAATCYEVVLQKEIDDSMKARIYAIITSIGNSTIPVGILIYGILLDKVKLYWATLILGLIAIPLTLFLYIIYQKNEVRIKSANVLPGS